MNLVSLSGLRVGAMQVERGFLERALHEVKQHCFGELIFRRGKRRDQFEQPLPLPDPTFGKRTSERMS